MVCSIPNTNDLYLILWFQGLLSNINNFQKYF